MSEIGVDEQKAMSHLEATGVSCCPEFHRWQLKLEDPSFMRRLNEYERFAVLEKEEWLEKVREDSEKLWRGTSMMREHVVELADAVIAFRVAGRPSTDSSLAQAIQQFEEERGRMMSEIKARRADSE